MYGFTPMATIEKLRPPPREEIEQLQECLRLDQAAHGFLVDRRHGHDGQRAIDDQHAEHEEDPPADIRRAERVDQCLEHG